MKQLQEAFASTYTNGKQNLHALSTFFDKRDSLVKAAIQEWITFVNEKDITTVIISIGSANAPTQQNPVCALFFEGNTAILNIDDQFYSENALSTNNCFVDYISSIIDVKETPESYTLLKNQISQWVQSDKKVVFMSHTYPYAYVSFNAIIKENLNYLSHTFAYVGSYHATQPVAVYSKQFFTSKDNPKKQNFINSLWGRYKSFTQEEIERFTVRHDINEYGEFYSNINSIKPEHLFKPKRDLISKSDINNNENDNTLKTEGNVYNVISSHIKQQPIQPLIENKSNHTSTLFTNKLNITSIQPKWKEVAEEWGATKLCILLNSWLKKEPNLKERQLSVDTQGLPNKPLYKDYAILKNFMKSKYPDDRRSPNALVITISHEDIREFLHLDIESFKKYQNNEERFELVDISSKNY